MGRKEQIDSFGVISLVGFSLLLAFNQVVIKVTNGGFQPVFFAGMRSVGAVICLLIWMRWRKIPLSVPRRTLPAALLIGVIFAIEFIFMFTALDLTTVSRSSVLFYSMPVWLALAGHVLLPGERLTPIKSLGLLLAMLGVAIALMNRDDGQANLVGDLCALAAAMSWAGIALCARATSLKEMRAEVQLFWQVLVSAPILLAVSVFFGPFLRDPTLIHYAGAAFQIVIVVSIGFIFWLWLLSIYPASSVASFSFLSPVFGVFLGWALLDEPFSEGLVLALFFVVAGLVLINRPSRGQVPQKV
ncbi:DMT family transporter [Litoreibacter roseus]|uniref:Transporter n=1 Tax=Litoreibacter roseus TaxID=2601869 RepID=A0A6N6JC88_9RHOB|nr:DMT family transporter [Litoreibacter roseus]GFE63694.1 transporter [Litoreibacter roseus]